MFRRLLHGELGTVLVGIGFTSKVALESVLEGAFILTSGSNIKILNLGQQNVRIV